MSKPRRRPLRRTRILGIDDGLCLITTRDRRRLEAERLDAAETTLALKMLDDCHAEIEAIVLGGRGRGR